MSIDYLLEGSATEQIEWLSKRTYYGGDIKGSRRSIAHLFWTNEQCIKRFDVEFGVLQSAYNSGVEASAGTHDYDAVYDTFIPSVDWWTQQRFFRECGWAAWYRYPPSFGHHIHMVSLGYETRVGIYVPGQVNDYYAHKSGLSGHVADNTWHPENIKNTIFSYNEWKAKEGDDLPYSEEELYRIVRKGVRDETKGFREGSKNRDAKLREVLVKRFAVTDAQLDEIQKELEDDE